MCWSATASIAMVGAGAAATTVAIVRNEPRAIWMTLGFFTIMEGLQATGYAVVDDCGTPANRTITILSYLHIALQPLFINAFAMAIAPTTVQRNTRRAVYGVSGFCSAVLLMQLVPAGVLGECRTGEIMCGSQFCLVSGSWHIGWQVPLNGMFNPLSDALGTSVQFPTYLFSVFVLPLIYGAWRFVTFHVLAGPVLAMALTSDPFEMPAVWCLFSIGILLISLSPFIRFKVMGARDPRDLSGSLA